MPRGQLGEGPMGRGGREAHERTSCHGGKRPPDMRGKGQKRKGGVGRQRTMGGRKRKGLSELGKKGERQNRITGKGGGDLGFERRVAPEGSRPQEERGKQEGECG